MTNTVKFSAFPQASRTDSSTQFVGLASGLNIRLEKQLDWTTAGRPVPPYDGLIGYNTTLHAWEYWNNATLEWVQLVGGGVSAGLVNELAWYASTGNNVSGLPTVLSSSLSTNSLGVPTWIPLVDGQIVIGSTSGSPIAASLTAGTGISITPGSNSITISTSGISGTVTSIATNNGLTGGTITTTGTIGLASIANNTVLANISGGSLFPSSTTVTALLDSAIGNVQGDILYRNASSWVVLPPGTAGEFLSTGGPAANPSWVSSGSSSSVIITDDTTTNATMYPTWVTANSGSLPLKVSSTKLSFNPSTATLTLTGFLQSIQGINHSSGSLIAQFVGSAPSVNYVSIHSSVTGVAPAIIFNGSDPFIPGLLASKGGNFVFVDNTSTFGGSIKLLNATGTQGTQFTVTPAQATSVTFIVPAVDGVLNQPWVTNGAGQLSFGTALAGLTGKISAPTAIADSLGNNVLGFIYAASAVNSFTMTNAATTQGPQLAASGPDPIVIMSLSSKGGNFSLLDNTATNGALLTFRNAANTFGTSLTVATAQSTNLILALPSVDGILNQPMVTSGTGVLTFGTAIGGLTGKIQAPTAIASSAGLNVLSFGYTASAVNNIQISNASTGQPPTILATGSNATIGIAIAPKSSDVGIVDALSAVAPKLKMFNAAGSFGTSISVTNAQATNLNLILPAVDGILNQPMVTSGAGVLSFGTAIGGLTGNITAPANIASAAGEPILNFSYVASAVNYFSIANSIAGGGPVLFSNGTSASIPITIATKNSDVNIFDITATVAPKLRLFNAAVTQAVGLQAPTALASSLTFTLPALDGAVNTGLITNGSGVLSFTGNAVLQRVSTQTGAVATGTGTIPLDDTIPQITEGTEFMTRAITPKSATSILRIDVVFNCAISLAGGNGVLMALFQDSTANALSAVACANVSAAAPVQLVLTHTMTSGTTSSTTFRIRAGCNVAATTTFNGVGGARVYGGVYASSIVITEYAN